MFSLTLTILADDQLYRFSFHLVYMTNNAVSPRGRSKLQKVACLPACLPVSERANDTSKAGIGCCLHGMRGVVWRGRGVAMAVCGVIIA